MPYLGAGVHVIIALFFAVHAVRSGHISITPIHVDLTRYQALEQVASWVGGLSTTLEPSA